ncbi:MAG: single-stranded DNA-binding protein [Ignavibacteriae bacterium]|nr:single-stranded DNA-binding protein [Ignavibacteriota bacterium]
MAFSLNRVTLIGNLGADPELRSTPQGTPVCTVNIATTERYKDKSGEWKDSTEWHKVVFWDRLADNVSKYLKKGSKVYVEGKLKYRQYEKDGITRYMTEIYAQSMVMMTKEGDGASSQRSTAAEPDSFDESAFADTSSTGDEDIPF